MTNLRWLLLLLCLTMGIPACQAADATTPRPVTPTPVPKVVEKINAKDGAAMVWIPAGEFLMGSTDAQVAVIVKEHPDWPDAFFFHEKPQHTVKLDGYWIYKNDVTVAQYKKFCAATARKMPTAPEWGWIDEHPVVNVNWDDAAAYARWAGVALPTEAQWEKAARGTDGRIYPWGNEWNTNKCNNWDLQHPLGKTSLVGNYSADVSPYGCMDMAGNVCQWCADWYDENYFKNSPTQNPTGPATGTTRVLRGGSWFNPDPAYFRASYRYGDNPTFRYHCYGFRCVLRSPGA